MLFEPYNLRGLPLRNHLVMAPMTRNRASVAHVPTPIMVDYYAARADIGLIITEGTSPAPDGLGYARIPGLFNAEHVKAWKAVTDAVHAHGGRIFVQLMHTGRASAAAHLPAGARTVGPMTEAMADSVYTDTDGMQPADVPHALAIAYTHARRMVREGHSPGVTPRTRGQSPRSPPHRIRRRSHRPCAPPVTATWTAVECQRSRASVAHPCAPS